MIDWVNIPPSILTWTSGIIIVLIGVYFSRKKTGAEASHMITEANMQLLTVYSERAKGLDERVSLLESQIRRHKEHVSSVEYDLGVYQTELRNLEGSHEGLQKKMRDWSRGIEILIAQIERHDSRPDWTPAEDD